MVPGEFFEVRVDASLVTRRSHVSQLEINRSTILKRLSSASVTSANDFLERIVMSLHVNSVSATCGCNLAPFIRPRGINVASAAALSTS